MMKPCKNLNYSRIYTKIAKQGKTITELAEEYGMPEEDFMTRINMGLNSKLYADVIKSNKKALKERENAAKRKKQCVAKNKEATEDMSVAESETTDNSMAEEVEETDNMPKVSLSELEAKKTELEEKISILEKARDEEKENFSVREEALAETKKIFEKAKEALENAEKAGRIFCLQVQKRTLLLSRNWRTW